MNMEQIKEELYNAIYFQLKEFSKNKENSKIYAISFDINDFRFVTRFNTETNFKVDYEKNADTYKSFGQEYYENMTLTGPKYESGDFLFLDTIAPVVYPKELKDFFDSLAYYDCGYIEDENNLIPKENLPENSENFILSALIECANKLKNNINFIDTTDNFIIYVSLHDVSEEQKLEIISKTVDAELFNALSTK